eukprot:280790-Chlamydomonas_euryale.AAC.1
MARTLCSIDSQVPQLGSGRSDLDGTHQAQWHGFSASQHQTDRCEVRSTCVHAQRLKSGGDREHDADLQRADQADLVAE